MIRKFLAGAIVAILAVALAQPSTASTAPSQVGLVSFIYGRTQALVLSWPVAGKATSYEIFRSTRMDMSGAIRVGATRSTRFTATGLTQGRTYCFQVRAKNGSTAGKRSARTCKPTIRAEGATRGPIFRVLTYNVCSRVCEEKVPWEATRQPLALDLIASKNPDVIAAQEADFLVTPEGYSLAHYKSGKRLLYRTSRFTIAQTCAETCTERTGEILMGDYPERNHKTYAVWAELIDLASDRHVIFVDVHTTPGTSETRALNRKSEINVLRRAMAVNNPARLPVVYAGDFNSNKSRPNDYVASVFHNGGYADGVSFWDSYDLARGLRNPNFNSFNGFQATPKVSYTWGDHVDHLWVNPKTTRVLRWETVASFTGSNYTIPRPSDHNALSMDIQVN